MTTLLIPSIFLLLSRVYISFKAICVFTVSFHQLSRKVNVVLTKGIMILLQKENCSSFDALAESAGKIAYYNFMWQYPTLLFVSSAFSCGVDVFVESYNKNVLIGQDISYPWFVESTTQFVLFVKDNEDILNNLQQLINLQYNNAGRYIIICNSYECDETEAVQLFWNYRIGNVILIKYNHLHRIDGFTFFQDESCGPNTPSKLKHWEDCIYKDKEDYCRDYMFPLKFNNLYRCPLIVSTFVQEPYMELNVGAPSGADGSLLNIMIETLNATLVLMTPRRGSGWGSLQNNGTWFGSLADIYYDWANFSMTSASITLHRFQYFQMSRNYNTLSVVWVTHPSDFEPSYFKLLRPYGLIVRYVLFINIIFIICMEIILTLDTCKSVKKILHLTKIPNNVVLSAWQICMSLPVGKLPKNSFYKHSALIWIWYCFFIRTFYQVYLINSLQTDVRASNVHTIENAIDEGYSFGGGLALKDYFIEQPNIYDNWKVVDSDEIFPIMFKLSKGMKFVLAMNLETTKVFLKDPSRHLHILPQKILNSPTVIFFKKYSWLTQSLNTVLTRLVEAGIPDKLLEDVISRGRRVKDYEEVKAIKLEHYKACFAILILGWITSSFIAVIEKIVYVRYNRTHCINPTRN